MGFRVYFVALAALVCAACSDAKEAPGNDDPTNTPGVHVGETTYQDLPVALCDMAPYDLLDPATLGQVVEVEDRAVVDMPADSLEEILAAGGLNLTTKHDVKVFRYRYTTQDRGQEVEATALIGFPVGESVGNDPLPLASFSHATNGFSDPCAAGKSFILQMAIASLASQGYVVAATDYIGMTSFGPPATTYHAYMIAEPAAIANWDALLAAEKLLATVAPELSTRRDVILAGGSQGSQTAFFQERMGPYYAPDYNVAGIVGFVPVIDMLKSSRLAVESFTNNSFYNAVQFVAGNDWYGFQVPLASFLTNEEPHFLGDNAETIFFDPNRCAYDSDVQTSLDTVEKIYSAEHIAMVTQSGTTTTEHWECMVRENSIMYSSIPKLRNTPAILFYGELDVMIPPQTYEHGLGALCESGDPVHYNICTGAEHSEGIIWSLPEALNWASARLAGESMGPNCELQAAHCCAGSPAEVCE